MSETLNGFIFISLLTLSTFMAALQGFLYLCSGGDCVWWMYLLMAGGIAILLCPCSCAGAMRLWNRVREETDEQTGGTEEPPEYPE